VQALKVRALIFRLLLPFTQFNAPSDQDLALFNVVLQEVTGLMSVISTQDGFVFACHSDDPLERVVCEVVRSTADLLLSNRPERIKQCAECGWLFFDATRNGSRRWCDMNSCGNRAKAVGIMKG